MESEQHLSEMLKEYDDLHLAFYHYLQREWIKSGMDVLAFADQLLDTANDFREKALDDEV